jgi:ELWxxDGT repeat protein
MVVVKNILLFILLAGKYNALFGQEFSPIKDINSNGSSLSYLMSDNEIIGDNLFFIADNGLHGPELWISDGSANGTKLVKDIRTPWGSNPVYFTEVGDNLFLYANNGGRYGLWVSDGTELGTYQIENVNVFYEGTNASIRPINFNGSLYFKGDDSINGQELWLSNGTALGTELVKNINLTGGSYPEDFTIVGNKLFFSADDDSGRELWVSDVNTTRLVNRVKPQGGSNPRNFVAYKGLLFYSAADETHGEELWVSDGTLNGTKQFKDINLNGSSSPSNLTVAGDYLFFSVYMQNGFELWVSDGSKTGTIRVEGVNLSACTNITYLNEVNGKLFFASCNETNSYKLWMIDKSENEILSMPISTGFKYVIEIDSIAYFINGNNLWRSDGTPDGTSQVNDDSLEVSFLLNSLNGYLYLSADNGQTGFELYKMDLYTGEIIPVNSFDKGEVYVYGNDLFIKPDKIVKQINIYDNSGTLLYQTDPAGKNKITLPHRLKGIVIVHYQKEYYWSSFKTFLE